MKKSLSKVMLSALLLGICLNGEVCFGKDQSLIAQNAVTASNAFKLPELTGTQAKQVSRWANVSSVQQFLYKNEGIAYAYVYNGKLNVHLPHQFLKLKMEYPLLGDVISDEEGNIYIVWGKEGNTSSDQTIFISKYSPKGTLLKTTGFKGESVMGESGNTKLPFDAGNCVATIGKDCLMVNYARTMYSGHQSNNVIGVNLKDMSPVSFEDMWEIPYTSHSFAQSILWREKYNDFVYIDQGDAYDRGFVLKSGENEQIIFHFYLQPNANYDMFVVNETFAQLGNIVEVEDGIAIAAASAKTIGEAAKKEKQNLFLQIYDPSKKALSSAFLGGVQRSGKTATDINDHQNAPLTSVTDYGVIWLTNYTDQDVIAPQIVKVDDQLVILWSSQKDTYYMVVSQKGQIKVPATSLKGIPLNSFEKPIVFDHGVYWIGVANGNLQTYRLSLDDKKSDVAKK